MPKRTRDRQLAKLAARRQAEKARLKRRRSIITGTIGVVVGLVLLVVGIKWLTGNGTSAASSVSPTVSATPSAGPSPCGSPTPPPGATDKKPTFKAPPVTIDPSKTYTATFKTTCGDFTAQLLAKTATESVNSFVFLADKGFYDGSPFHRIVKGFIIQSGAPNGDPAGGPGYDIPVTVTKGETFGAPGVLAFAHSQVKGNESQFFITLAPAPNLNPTPDSKYTIFGNVTKGINVVQKIGSVPTVAGPACAPGDPPCSPTEPVFILSITINKS